MFALNKTLSREFVTTDDFHEKEIENIIEKTFEQENKSNNRIVLGHDNNDEGKQIVGISSTQIITQNQNSDVREENLLPYYDDMDDFDDVVDESANVARQNYFEAQDSKLENLIRSTQVTKMRSLLTTNSENNNIKTNISNSIYCNSFLIISKTSSCVKMYFI